MKFLAFDRVLCLSPHPDDVEYGLAGTVMKYHDTIFDLICFSIGSFGDLTSGAHRHDEVRTFWDGISNANLFFSDVAFVSGKAEEAWLNYLEEHFLRERDYDAVVIPPLEDSHYEHRTMHHLGFPLVRARRASVISYSLPSTLNAWDPNVLVDITAQYEEKLRRLQVFHTQNHRPYFEEDVLRAFHSNYQAAKRGARLIERFRIHEMLA